MRDTLQNYYPRYVGLPEFLERSEIQFKEIGQVIYIDEDDPDIFAEIEEWISDNYALDGDEEEEEEFDNIDDLNEEWE